MPFFFDAAILSRMRSPVTSRSNWAKDNSTLSVRRLADAHAAGRLVFFGELDGLRGRQAFAAHLAPLNKKKWFVYAKATKQAPLLAPGIKRRFEIPA
jgi:hypothetical protein